ncbi:MAG: Gfo/Idh/MocA family protein [Dehalococcoidia bacterium]
MNWKLAIVGCGNWGQNLVRNFFRLLGPERVICCDLNQQTLWDIKCKYPDIEVVEDTRCVLEDPSVMAVAIATPTQTHYSLARQSLLRGKHVFVEKPLADSVADAEALCTLAKQRSRVLMVDHLLIFHPAIEKLTELIHAGELGDICQIYSRRTNLGVVRSEENVLWSLGPHDVAVMLGIMQDSPTKVTANGGVYLQPHIGLHDVVFLTLVFPDGQMGNFHLSWFDPRKTREITVVGSRKMAVFDDMEPVAKLRIFDKTFDAKSPEGPPSAYDGGITEIPCSNEEPLTLVCQHFLEGIEEGRVELCDGTAGLEVVRVLESAQRSLDEDGMPIELPRHVPHG